MQLGHTFVNGLRSDGFANSRRLGVSYMAGVMALQKRGQAEVMGRNNNVLLVMMGRILCNQGCGQQHIGRL